MILRSRHKWFNRYRLLPILFVFLGACGGGGGSDPGTTLPLPTPTPVPPTAIADSTTNHAFSTDHFTGSQNCSSCHDGLRDAVGDDVSIVVDWQATMMANSARDPLWRAKVASEIKRNPALQEEIETTCGRCHVPMASTEVEFSGISAALFGDSGLLHPDNPLFDAANEGVSCTLCHQIEDSAALGSDAGFSGNFTVAFNFGIDRLLYGQYDNPFVTPMQNQIGFTPTASAHVSSSELCATCHNLSTRVVDTQGIVTNQSFPEQMVYTEWQNSVFAATDSCQDCHMPLATGDMTISTRPTNGLPLRADFAQHTFVGGNTYMLDILGQNAQALNITASGFDKVIAETRTFLASAASLTLENIVRAGDDLDFTVRVSNLSGHKFPTGYPSRRAWLHVTISDASGVVVFESGAIDAMGKISGLESDSSPGQFEAHYDIITSADQVQSYETIMQNVDGDLTYTLLEAATYRKDNRLLPTGMDKTLVPGTIQPRGDAMTDSDFVGGGDRVHYQIAGLAPGNYTIEASLNYQTMAYGFGQDLFIDSDEARVAFFEDLDNGARMRFELISSDSGSINF
ncbi:MAG: hypothetical protein GXP15_09330 [Gammaproteobacteria bacterium]|nr:hypothetical protein [Gammaproteobacteria bacterium]